MATCARCGRKNPDDARFCNGCGAALAEAPAPREQRKVVTVVFCDVTGSTELGEKLDPEALRTLLARYFEQMKSSVERHGGTVEKFIGDAVMAVFGVPAVHEDDAMRALRAAAEMRDAFPALGVVGRVGVATGEVVTGTEERLATGDAVNVAARLEQAAAPGEILLSEATLRLTRDAVDVEAMAPLSLKGKAEPVSAYRLIAISHDATLARRLDTPMVGRETELRRLRDAYDQAVRDSSCQLFTILGPAGVGKSRLASEFLGSLHDSRVVQGHCLSYGEGITYWPVVEVIKQLPEPDHDPVVTTTIRSLLGSSSVAVSTAEIAWAFRKLLGAVATERPLVCVFDDVHWGEPTFLDLVEHVADLSRDAPILLLCMARPELLDRRAGWAGGKLNATTVLLEPLGPTEIERMIENLAPLDDDLRARVREAAEGNPLFVEEMVALVQESGDREVTVPPTIQALLAARLDQLDAPERSVLERGAIEGRIFHRGAVQALGPEERELTTRLTSLVRKELVRPDKAQLAGEDAFRFRHLLIRDAAYDALPKATRAELHERFAVWLQEHGGDLVELDEILGHHLERAYRYRTQLAPEDERARRIASQARERLVASGQRAFARGDIPASINLFERAAALSRADDPQRIRMLPSLGRALIDTGDWQRADIVLSEAVEVGRAIGERTAAASASVALAWVRAHSDPLNNSHADVRVAVNEAIRVFEELGEHSLLARALQLSGITRLWGGDATGAIEECERSARYARDAGDRAQESLSSTSIIAAATLGPVPVAQALELIDRVGRKTEGMRRVEMSSLIRRAHLEAMRGNFETARDLIGQAEQLARDLGQRLYLASQVLWTLGEVELLAGDSAAAERALRTAAASLEQIGDWASFASIAPSLADALHAQDRIEEAAPSIELAARFAAADDIDAQIGQRRVRAYLAAHRGELLEAERLAREAVDLAARTDYLNVHAKSLLDLAEVLCLHGPSNEATIAIEQAARLYDQKGNVVMAERARRRLAELVREP